MIPMFVPLLIMITQRRMDAMQCFRASGCVWLADDKQELEGSEEKLWRRPFTRSTNHLIASFHIISFVRMHAYLYYDRKIPIIGIASLFFLMAFGVNFVRIEPVWVENSLLPPWPRLVLSCRAELQAQSCKPPASRSKEAPKSLR